MRLSDRSSQHATRLILVDFGKPLVYNDYSVTLFSFVEQVILLCLALLIVLYAAPVAATGRGLSQTIISGSGVGPIVSKQFPRPPPLMVKFKGRNPKYMSPPPKQIPPKKSSS